MLQSCEDSPRTATIGVARAGWRTIILALLAGWSPLIAIAAETPAARPRFSDYSFDFSLVEDTVIPEQQVWLRIAQTNITDHEVPKLDLTPGGYVYSVWLVDSAGVPLPVGMPHFDGGELFHGTLSPRETESSYMSLGPNIWFFAPESLRAALVGHTWGVAVRFSTYIFGEADSLAMKRSPLPLTVVDAAGDELEATVLLKHALAAIHAGTPEEWRAPCRELLQRFPNSRLVDEALHVLHFGAKPSDQLEIARDQVRMNPGAPQLINWLAEIRDQLGVAVYNDFLRDLARDHPKAAALEVLKEAR